MAHCLIKASADEDFYGLYSSVVDNFIAYGSRAQIESYERAPSAAAFGRADATGSSAFRVDPEFAWDDPEIMLCNEVNRPEGSSYGLLRREDMRAFLESVENSDEARSMVRWVYQEDYP